MSPSELPAHPESEAAMWHYVRGVEARLRADLRGTRMQREIDVARSLERFYAAAGRPWRATTVGRIAELLERAQTGVLAVQQVRLPRTPEQRW
ncbi:MAG: hypothetical protein CMN30_17405 [Sandaracinus sp.]|nr:hypothetical protein [Sandaracinus sp.]|tara:strand:- start:128 stop:406 length:279 start_codon:yes stop_codon:yes gene_type:complete